MTSREEAIAISKSFINNNEFYQSFVIDIENLLERETLWYVPFKELNPAPNEFFTGAYNGIIVDKSSTDYFQPGSALNLEEWMYGFKIGLRGERYDLHIEKVIDYRATLDMLDRLELTYVEIELEGGVEWKIPKSFKRKEIKKRLRKMPCLFKNQSFTFAIKEFRQIKEERIFEYKLLKTENRDSNLLGELIENRS
ncbi:hypothetical protein KFE94_16450 [bacterium SCSIO 12643]|nr:hypothetical protein KFE94_16450 [bacterium SCSIO 12643]